MTRERGQGREESVGTRDMAREGRESGMERHDKGEGAREGRQIAVHLTAPEGREVVNRNITVRSYLRGLNK